MYDVEKNFPNLRLDGFEVAWTSTQLTQIILSLDAGVSVNSDDTPAKGHELGILKTSCVSRGYFDSDENKRVVDQQEQQRLKEPVIADTIVISRMNTPALVGLSGLVTKTRPNIFLPDRLWAAKVRDSSSPRFIAYLLAAPRLRNLLSARATGTSGSMKNITKSDVLTLPAKIPSLLEQQKIADFLSAVDKRIQQLTQKKALLEDYKKGVMQQLFMQAIRFKDDDGKDFPDWEKKQLSEVCELVGGLTYSPDDIAETGLLVLRSSNVQNGRITFDDNVYVTTEVSNWNISRSGDILVCVRNGSKKLIGKNARIPDDCPRSTHGAFMTVLRGEANELLFHLLQTDDYKRNVHRNLGATINSINGSDLKKFRLMFPSSATEQTKIAKFLSAIDRKVESVATQITETQTFKRGLLQQMFV